MKKALALILVLTIIFGMMGYIPSLNVSAAEVSTSSVSATEISNNEITAVDVEENKEERFTEAEVIKELVTDVQTEEADVIPTVETEEADVVPKDDVENEVTDDELIVIEEKPEEPLTAVKGHCGNNLSWEIDSLGHLSIYHDGATYFLIESKMWDWTSAENVPWYYQREKISSVSVPSDVTHIGNYAFYGCTSLKKFSLPKNTTSLGDYAFYKCSSLLNINIPSGVTNIGNYTFYGCTSLINLAIPDSVTSIGTKTFYSCKNLTIYGNIGSYAELYANNNNISFVSIIPITGMLLTGSDDETLRFDKGTQIIPTFETYPTNNNDIITFISKNSTVVITENSFYGLSAGTCTVTAQTLGGFTYDFTVVVRGMDSIEISKQPKKLTYNYGEELSVSDMVVTANYSDGASETVTDYSLSGYDKTKEGKQTVTVAYTACGTTKYATFDITLIDNRPKVTEINVLSVPDITTYLYGEALDTTGLQVEAVYDNGTSEIVTDYEITGFDSNTLGTQTMTITYHSFTATFDVLVKKMTGITVVPVEKELIQYKYSSFDNSQIVVTAFYSDDSTEIVTDYSVSGFNSLKLGNQTITITYKEFTATIIAKVIINNTVTVSEETVEIGTPVTITATGGSTYKFYYNLNGSWTRIQDFSENSTCVWTPAKGGTYELYVDINNSDGSTACKHLSFTVTEPDKFTAYLKFAYASPQKAGTTIKLTASATGGKGNLKYKFYSECNGVWTKLWDYDTRDTYNWHATTVGTHTVYCDIMDEEGNVACAVVKYEIVKGESFVADLNANRISGQLVGTEIRLLGGSSNGIGTVKYKFYYEIGGNWVRLCDFSTQDYFLWTPTKAGYYNLYMDAQDEAGNTASKRLCITIDEGQSLEVTNLTANPENITVGTETTLTGVTSGGSGTITYKFYYECGGSWVKIQDFSEKNTCKWTPTKAGTYHIYLDAIDSTKNTQCLMKTFIVK